MNGELLTIAKRLYGEFVGTDVKWDVLEARQDDNGIWVLVVRKVEENDDGDNVSDM
jgi:hypothetical protein